MASVKKTIFRILPICLMFSCGAVEPVIYCSYDNGINADFGGTRGGDVAGSTANGVTGVLNPTRGALSDAVQRPQGISGKAFLIGRSDDGKHGYSATYTPVGGLSPDAGTVMFWIAPQNWNGRDSHFHLFFSAFGENQQMILYKYHTGEKILFYYKTGNRVTALEYKVSDWKEKEFHHIAAAWNEKEISLYVDGNFCCSRALLQKAANPFASFTVGTLSWWGNDSGRTLIDELKLYNSYLGADEVAKEFSRVSDRAGRSVAPLVFGVSERTPVPDGIVREFEYAFSGSGFRNLSTRKYALRQSRFFLAKDQRNLYVAMVGAGKNLKADNTQRDGALWEDDSIEVHFAAPNGGASKYQFIFNSRDVFYDAKDDHPEWNAEGVRSVSRVENGIWTIEMVFPLSNFAKEDLKNIRMNLCRAYRDTAENTTLGPCVGRFADSMNFAEVRFNPGYPAVHLSEFGSLGDQHLALRGKLRGAKSDSVQVKLYADAPVLPFQFRESFSLDTGKTAAFSAESRSLPKNRRLNVEITSKAYGDVYRDSLEYMDQTPLTFAYLYTDLPEKIFRLVCRNSRIGGEENIVTIRFIDSITKKVVLEKKQILPSSSVLVTASVPVGGLKAGDYRMEYSFSDPKGRVFFRSHELYRVYPDKTRWTGTQAGLSDDVPAPWTPIAATPKQFTCWGREYCFEHGLPSSILSQGIELLAAPVELKLGKEKIVFSSRMQKKGVSFAEYSSEAEKSGIRFTLHVKAEFDGLLWCTLKLQPKMPSAKVGPLTFCIPLKREHSNYFDSCRSAGNKVTFQGVERKKLANDLSLMPFFWCGSDSVGLMAGMPSLKGWHVRNRSRSMILDVSPKIVRIDWNIVDEPFELKTPRTIEFYLHATPVKPKNMAALSLRSDRNTVMWTGYWSQFYEMQDSAFLNYEKIKQIRSWATSKKLFYYASAKGVSCYSPDWNFFGKYWISSPPRLGEYQIDSDVSSREKRNQNTFTYGCLFCRCFLDYKIDSLARMVELEALDLKNIYFDIAWPRSCDNREHGCGWVDDFGRHQTSFDISGVREFYLRAWKILRKKNPDAMFAGHLTSTRTPADSFFDILVRGEVYDRMVAERGSYYDVFNPDGLRISEASRSNEQSIWMLSQFTRSLILFRPEKYKNFKQDDPKTDAAIRHYLGYLMLHNLVNWGSDVSMRENMILAAQERVGWNENTVFHPYWAVSTPVKITKPESNRILASCYTNADKALVVVMNDTDRAQTIHLQFDGKTPAFARNRNAVEVFGATRCALSDGTMSLDMLPREAKILLFD